MQGGTTARGNQAQDDAKALLEKQGFLVTMAKPAVRKRWSREANDFVTEVTHDYFGCLDILAFKADRVRCVQVTHPSGVYERVVKIQRIVPSALLESPLYTWEVWSKVASGFVIRLVKAVPA